MMRFTALRNILLALALVNGAWASSHAGDLEARVESLIRNASLGSTEVGVSIRDLDTGRQIVSIDEIDPMIPASNMKLFTSGAALHILGEDFHFQTSLILDRDTLWVVGGGDPALGDPVLLEEMEWTIDTLLDRMVQRVRDSGVRELETLIIDDRIFDRNHVHPDWPRDQLDKRYCAEVAGLNFGLNVVHIKAAPSKSGGSPVITSMTPNLPWILPKNEMHGKPGKDAVTRIGIRRTPNTNKMTVYGRILSPIGADVTISNVPEVFSRLLKTRLEAEGIRVGSIRLAEGNTPAPKADGAEVRELLRIKTQLGTVMERCNTNSQNLHAESMLKRIGHENELTAGSWANGARAVRMVVIDRLGPEHAEGIRQSDGSGMSRQNKVTPETVTAWLTSFARDEDLGPLFLESLADPKDAGTLRGRFDDLPSDIELACKTGYINGVCCLSGVVSNSNGRGYAFSVLCNEIPGNVPIRSAKKLQEAVVDLLAKQLQAGRNGSNRR